MKKQAQTPLAKPAKKAHYVIVDGQKMSRTWAALLANKGTGEIIDMKAVLK